MVERMKPDALVDDKTLVKIVVVAWLAIVATTVLLGVPLLSAICLSTFAVGIAAFTAAVLP
jgi:hypothetical protein